jgi:multidrug efflux system membrane fusion protein
MGTMRMRAVFPNEDRSLVPGFFARLRVTGSEKYQALLIPDQAVGTDQAQKFVYVINDKDEVEYRPVKLGPISDGLRVVHEGVRPADWVVVEGLMTIRPGSKVTPKKVGIASGNGGTNGPAVTQSN